MFPDVDEAELAALSRAFAAISADLDAAGHRMSRLAEEGSVISGSDDMAGQLADHVRRVGDARHALQGLSEVLAMTSRELEEHRSEHGMGTMEVDGPMDIGVGLGAEAQTGGTSSQAAMAVSAAEGVLDRCAAELERLAAGPDRR